MVYCFKSASLRSNEQVASLKLRTLGAKLGNRLDLTQKLHQKCREALPPFTPIYTHSTHSMQNLLLVSGEIESHSCSKQKTEETTHADNHWTIIEQPLNLNNHWTIIEQTLFNPSKYTRRFVKWNPSFWKTKPRRLGAYKSPRALQGVKIACMGRQLRYLDVPKKRTAKGVFYFVKRKQAETVWTRRTAFLKHECSWIIHELNMNWFFEYETRECSEINETFNETINGHSWRNISCWERTLFETWEKKEEGTRRKKQHFWAFFGRFDINIFNFREHFPPRNFAYSAHNFALPSPNLN